MAWDLSNYLAPPNGKPLLLSTGENCQCTQAPDKWCVFSKNALYEELAYDAQFVFRGADTSALYTPDGLYHGTYYIQHTEAPDGSLSYGAPWAKRFMAVGDVFFRVCTIVTYDYLGKQIRRDDNVGSDITLVAHHDTLTTPAGVSVPDVLELEWGVHERYFYANGYGLVMFQAADGSVSSYLTSFSAQPMTPHPVPTPRAPIQEKSLVVTTKPPVGLANPVATTVALSAGLNLRAQPFTNSAVIRTMPKGEHVTFYSAPLSDSGDYLWAYGKDALGNTGYAAVAVNGQPSFNPPVGALMPAPTPTWTVALDVPFVSQLGTSAAKSNNDCLLASLLMLTRYWLKQQTGIVADLPTVDELEAHTSLANPNPPHGLTFQEGIALAKRLGFNAVYVQPMKAARIVDCLSHGLPVAALLDYSKYNPHGAQIAHILVVSGYNDTEFLTQDPYLLGANIPIAQAQLEAAMANSPGNAVGWQALTLA